MNEGRSPYDNNRSLFPELDEDQLRSPEWHLKKCKLRIGKEFVLNARGLLTPEIAYAAAERQPDR